MATGVESIADKLVPPAPSLTLGATLPGEQIASAAVRFLTEVITICNTPEMMHRRFLADLQAVLDRYDDDLKKAQQTGDISKVDQDSSG